CLSTRHRSMRSAKPTRRENMGDSPASPGVRYSEPEVFGVPHPRASHEYNIVMNPDTTQYDPRYLAGIVLFNRGDFFEAHEVWESLWMETFTPEKKFYQGLIQAAVALCHFCNGNMAGARKLYKSSREYMLRYGTPFKGLDVER